MSPAAANPAAGDRPTADELEADLSGQEIAYGHDHDRTERQKTASRHVVFRSGWRGHEAIVTHGSGRSTGLTLNLPDELAHPDHGPHVEQGLQPVEWIAGHSDEVGVVSGSDPALPVRDSAGFSRHGGS